MVNRKIVLIVSASLFMATIIAVLSLPESEQVDTAVQAIAENDTKVNLSQLVLMGQCADKNLRENPDCKEKDLNKDGKIDVNDMNMFVNLENQSDRLSE